ncbi:helix-turn-helix domain-containing protein [Phycisphaerales bacterium AB-hyl4]|uniref:Helix-turn-helix domain-containing protein n=1 Tax=Natronomicrosphaera hydrolytica TaxID=3242702 RepID=A0ABV4UAE7_9BACT
MTVNPSDLPNRVLAARQQCGMTQAELAEAAGLQQSVIAQIEGGRRKPSFDNLRRLALALHVSADHLLGLDEDSTSSPPAIAAIMRIIRDLPDDDLELLSAMAETMRKRTQKKRGSTRR